MGSLLKEPLVIQIRRTRDRGHKINPNKANKEILPLSHLRLHLKPFLTNLMVVIHHNQKILLIIQTAARHNRGKVLVEQVIPHSNQDKAHPAAEVNSFL
jgi:hypothetical protein